MRSRRWIAWAVYIVSVVLVFDVLGFVTWQMLKLERADVEATVERDLQERVRLALWRMDSFMAPLLAQESARPYFQYRASYPAERAYTRMWEEVQPGEMQVPSPLLTSMRGSGGSASELIRLHFQIEPDGQVTSPQVPTGSMLELAETRLGMTAQIQRSRTLLAQVRAMEQPSTHFDDAAIPSAAEQDEPAPTDHDQHDTQSSLKAGEKAQSPAVGDKRARAEFLNQTEASVKPRQSVTGRLLEGPILMGSFRPVWARIPPDMNSPQLLFIRPVILEGRSFRQGIWIDWPMLRRLLLSLALDLLPDADLVPVEPAEPDEGATTRTLASLPARLDPGPPPAIPPIGLSWTRQVLIVTWIAVIAGVVAIGLVLRASLQLSERRGRFVSAVTHELRTPLTTFCMYTEMLADGMVADDQTRRRYLTTLKGEAKRLAAIVENVLAYARLGRPRPSHRPRTAAGDLFDAIRDPVERRVALAQGSINLHLDPALRTRPLAADVETVERIIMNLVDNACKYGHQPGQPPRIEIDFAEDSGRVLIAVRDYGPGVRDVDAGRVFAAFHRGSDQQQHTQTGIGLGLALAKGLARELGGELAIEPPQGPGARFILRLRTA